jgi:hypothetical protein
VYGQEVGGGDFKFCEGRRVGRIRGKTAPVYSGGVEEICMFRH